MTKKSVFIFCLLIFPIFAYAHPGKTDHRGGHKCWKGCGEWELGYAEYHLHDKDWKPIRIGSDGKPFSLLRPDEVPADGPLEQPETARPADQNNEVKQAEIKQVKEINHNITVYEESILPFNLIILIVLALALMLALVFLRRRREKD